MVQKFIQKNILNIILVILLIVLLVLILVNGFDRFTNNNNNNVETLVINESLVKQNYNNLVKVLGKPTYLEKDGKNNMNSATWMSPLSSFNDFGKHNGCDYIKITGHISKKWHPHPANLFIIVGKYINVPEHLLGPIKYASETINVEQLFVPTEYSEHYYKTGEKKLALVTGSCASVTISAITVQFVMDMIQKYKGKSFNDIDEKIYKEFRNEYDRRIDDYLCGRGITDTISWYDPQFFGEADTAYLGNNKCLRKEQFSHYPECKELMKENNFCKKNGNHKCC